MFYKKVCAGFRVLSLRPCSLSFSLSLSLSPSLSLSIHLSICLSSRSLPRFLVGGRLRLMVGAICRFCNWMRPTSSQLRALRQTTSTKTTQRLPCGCTGGCCRCEVVAWWSYLFWCCCFVSETLGLRFVFVCCFVCVWFCCLRCCLCLALCVVVGCCCCCCFC